MRPRALAVVSLSLAALLAAAPRPARADDAVVLQGFYWDCPEDWWPTLEKEAPELAKAGFTGIWLPPPSKGGAGRASMGYDVYDHYDLGEFDQKGSVPTRFGTRKELESLIAALHKHGVKAYADVVLNQMANGEKEWNPLAKKDTYTRYSYNHAGPKIDFDWNDFHPSHVHPDQDKPYHNPEFGNDICQSNPHAGDALEKWGEWLATTIGFDGFRLDDMKGIDPGYAKEFLGHGAIKGKFAVAEVWDGNVGTVEKWVNDNDRRASAFDFPLFYLLKDMCNDGDGKFDLRRLEHAGLSGKDPMRAVTFVENHDTDRSDPVVTDKMMAYAFILTMEGEPCVFYKDYETRGLKKHIDPLIAARKKLCGGTTKVLHAGGHLYAAERQGNAKVPGAVLVLNTSRERKSVWVTVKKEWAGKDLLEATGQGTTTHVAHDARVEVSAPPRSYAVYSTEKP